MVWASHVTRKKTKSEKEIYGEFVKVQYLVFAVRFVLLDLQ